jgi:hypothetical protein
VTLNIQPITFFGIYNIDPVFVTSKYPPLEYDWPTLVKVESEMTGVYEKLYSAAQEAKQTYESIVSWVPEFGDAVRRAQQLADAAIRAANLSLSIQGRAA